MSPSPSGPPVVGAVTDSESSGLALPLTHPEICTQPLPGFPPNIATPNSSLPARTCVPFSAPLAPPTTPASPPVNPPSSSPRPAPARLPPPRPCCPPNPQTPSSASNPAPSNSCPGPTTPSRQPAAILRIEHGGGVRSSPTHLSIRQARYFSLSMRHSTDGVPRCSRRHRR